MTQLKLISVAFALLAGSVLVFGVAGFSVAETRQNSSVAVSDNPYLDITPPTAGLDPTKTPIVETSVKNRFAQSIALEVSVDGGSKDPNLDQGEMESLTFVIGNESCGMEHRVTYEATERSQIGESKLYVRMDREVFVPCPASQEGDSGNTPEEVTIEIKPCDQPPTINNVSEEVTPVVIANTGDFNPFERVDNSTLRFGDPNDVTIGGGATPQHTGTSGHPGIGHSDDKLPCPNGDGDRDLVVHFPISDADFEGDDTLGRLEGKTIDGTVIYGEDTVSTQSRGNTSTDNSDSNPT